MMSGKLSRQSARLSISIRRPGWTFSVAFPAKVALAASKGDKTLADLFEHLNLRTNQVFSLSSIPMRRCQRRLRSVEWQASVRNGQDGAHYEGEEAQPLPKPAAVFSLRTQPGGVI